MLDNLKRHRPDIKVVREGAAIACMSESPMGVWVHIQDVRDLLEAKDRAIAAKEADYKEACARLQTANLIKGEQKEKADKLLSCLRCLVMRDLIKDCPEKDSAIEIIKGYGL